MSRRDPAAGSVVREARAAAPARPYTFHDAFDGSGADSELDNTRLTIGLTLMTVGMIGSLIGTLYYRGAFHTYDESLRQSLRLCVSGMNLVDCNATPHSGPPGAQQPADEEETEP